MDIEQILSFAVEHGLSDIHLKVGRPPYFRKNGKLVQQKGVPEVTDAQVTGWIEQLADEKARAEFARDRDTDFAYGSPHGRFRVNAFIQRGAAAMALRHIPNVVRTVDDLELPEVLKDLALAPRGLILVTGATGMGKSTTLAAMVDHVNRHRACHVLTIEDPIEYVFEDDKAIVNQREVGRDTGNFPQALRAALRQDPDLILIGEMRDLETMETALHAAETGHLVLSSLHTVDAVETIRRVITLFPPHHQGQVRMQLASILRGVVSQRLIPTANGARTAACEVMIVNDLIRDMIADPARTIEIPALIRQGTDSYGMQTFDQAIHELWKRGRVSRKVALASASNPADLKLRFEGIDG